MDSCHVNSVELPEIGSNLAVGSDFAGTLPADIVYRISFNLTRPIARRAILALVHYWRMEET
jgi:hypothetical protein